jgi:hypothetical protein
VADPNSGQVLLNVAHPRGNHNGGQLAFGPGDGYLYAALGDGGGGGDPDGNGQDTGTLLGKILRLDVESGATPFAIPAGNPFASGGGRPEIWAYGLRNPWRFSFDHQTHDLFIADVGQALWEEVDHQQAGGRRRQCGWNIMEVRIANAATCNQTGLTQPVTEYDHSLGCDRRRLRLPRQHAVRPGRPLLLRRQCQGACGACRRMAPCGGRLLVPRPLTSTFGEDEAGEIYLADYSGGALYHVTALPRRVACRWS